MQDFIEDNTKSPIETAKFVRIEEDGVTEQICDLPIGRNVNDGTGALYWINRGFTPYDDYMFKKHAAIAKKEQEEHIKKLEAEVKKAEEAKAAEAKKAEDEKAAEIKKEDKKK